MESSKLGLFGKILKVNNEVKDKEGKLIPGVDRIYFLLDKSNGIDTISIKVPKELGLKVGQEVKLQVEPYAFGGKVFFNFVKLLGK